jgi:hypothetical protein
LGDPEFARAVSEAVELFDKHLQEKPRTAR